MKKTKRARLINIFILAEPIMTKKFLSLIVVFVFKIVPTTNKTFLFTPRLVY